MFEQYVHILDEKQEESSLKIIPYLKRPLKHGIYRKNKQTLDPRCYMAILHQRRCQMMIAKLAKFSFFDKRAI